MINQYSKKNNNKPNNNQSKEEVRGNWEAAFFQRGKIKIDEQCIKSNCPTGSFNPYNIPNLMNPKLSKEEEILEKHSKGLKLNKTESMIYDNFIDKHVKKIKSDLEKIELHGLNAKPETDEGRVRLLFKTIEYYLMKPSENSNELIYYAYNKIKEFKIPELYNMFYYAYTKMKEDNLTEYNYLDLIKKTNELPINTGDDNIKQLKKLDVPEKYLIKYTELIKKINDIIEDLDCINLQFNRFHSNMPPLNERGFVQLDPFQKEVITNIDNNKSIIVQAPTSAGKSILTGYLYTNSSNDGSTLKAIVVVPTDPLA